MNKYEKLIKEYSSEKLKEIVNELSASYSEDFIDYAKDELIRRGEGFTFDSETKKKVVEMSDLDLKNLVEKEWINFHLEYLEIARKEYLKRNFKNEAKDKKLVEGQSGFIFKKYPALRIIASIFFAFAGFIGIASILISIYFFMDIQPYSKLFGLLTIISGAIMFLGSLTTSESIRVVIDIEENTRMMTK